MSILRCWYCFPQGNLSIMFPDNFPFEKGEFDRKMNQKSWPPLVRDFMSIYLIRAVYFTRISILIPSSSYGWPLNVVDTVLDCIEKRSGYNQLQVIQPPEKWFEHYRTRIAQRKSEQLI